MREEEKPLVTGREEEQQTQQGSSGAPLQLAKGNKETLPSRGRDRKLSSVQNHQDMRQLVCHGEDGEEGRITEYVLVPRSRDVGAA